MDELVDFLKLVPNISHITPAETLSIPLGEPGAGNSGLRWVMIAALLGLLIALGWYILRSMKEEERREVSHGSSY